MENLNKFMYLILCLLPFYGSSQTSFYKMYTNNGYDFGQGVVQLEDSSYVVTGSSSSFVEGASQAFLLKVDSLGKYVWSKNYGGIESEGGRRVLYKKNVGFYIAGYTNSIGNGGFDAYLLKTDEQGVFQWQKSYGGTGWEKVNDAVMLSDTGIMMVGQTNSGTPGNDNIYIVRTDKNGDTLWTKNIGATKEDIATSVKILNDSICIIGGQTYVQDSLKYKSFLLSIKNNGEIQWLKTYGNDGDYCINDLVIIGNEINGVGFRKNKIQGDSDGYSMKTSLTGNFIYEFAYAFSGYETYEQISNYGRLNKVYVAYNQLNASSVVFGKDLFIGRFGVDLVYDNSALVFSTVGDEIVGQIIKTNDGGAVVVGYNSSFGSGGNNVFLTKIGSNDVFPIMNGQAIANPLVQVIEVNEYIPIDFSVYPNPVSSEIKIAVPVNFEGQFEVRDLQGKKMYSAVIKQNTFSYNIEYLEKGTYFISVISIDNLISTKMIVVL